MKRTLLALALAVPLISLLLGTTSPSGATTADWDPSGVPMPVGDLPGWHQVFADNFANDSYPLGSFTGCTPRGCTGVPSTFNWGATPDGTKHPRAFCQDYASKTVSVSGGVMNIWLHTDQTIGSCLGANLKPKIGSFTYGMYQVRFRADQVPGYKVISLLWPMDNVSGEIDMPETLDLTHVIHGALHEYAGKTPYLVYPSTAYTTGWHTATVQWTPTTVTFILDNTVLGTSSTWVPQKLMAFSTGGGGQIGALTPPAPSAQGNVQIDWVTVYGFAPPPTITSVSQSSVGINDSTTSIVLNGPGFTPDAQVTFSSPGLTQRATPTLLTSNQLSVPVQVAANTPLGPSDVTVTEPAGSATCSGCVTVDPAPAPAAASPPAPWALTTTNVSVSGQNFQSGLTVSTTTAGIKLGTPASVSSTSFTVPVTAGFITAGYYDFQITNPDGGTVACTGCLLVITPPGAPMMGSASVGTGQSTVTFSPPASDGYSPILHYTVTAYDTTNAANGGQTATGTASPLTVTGLTSGDRYVFRVTATNAVGAGVASASSNAVIIK